MKRIDGDAEVATLLGCAKGLITEAMGALRGPTALDHADRCIVATEALTRAEMVFNQALTHLERLTDGRCYTSHSKHQEQCAR